MSLSAPIPTPPPPPPPRINYALPGLRNKLTKDSGCSIHEVETLLLHSFRNLNPAVVCLGYHSASRSEVKWLITHCKYEGASLEGKGLFNKISNIPFYAPHVCLPDFGNSCSLIIQKVVFGTPRTFTVYFILV